MPRARSLKPGFFKNERLAALGPHAMLLFEGLWILADRDGRLEDRPKRIKAEVFPYFSQPVEKLLILLANSGFIERYKVGDESYIAIPTWKKHQNPHVKECASTIPAPCSNGACSGISGTSRADSGLLTPDTLTLGTRAEQFLGDECARFLDLYPKQEKLDQAARSWISLVSRGEITEDNVAEVFAGLDRHIDSAKWAEDDGKWIPDPSTFLMGNEKHSGRMWKDKPKAASEYVAPKRSSAGTDPNAEYVIPAEWFKNAKNRG